MPIPTAPANHDLQAIGEAFNLPGRFLSAAPYGSGHINDTYAAVYGQDDGTVRTILQRINTAIFRDPVALMENIRRVTAHQACKLKAAGVPDPERRTLTTLPARDGLPYHRDGNGNTWRAYRFIEGARTYDSIESEEQARQAARAFGLFQAQLADLPGPRLHETIVDFHHTPRRLEALEAALRSDPCGRARHVRRETAFVHERAAWAGELIGQQARGLIPERITHNDTKLNNVMLDDTTGEGICVIDLDTVMPGLALYDFGDMVRTATSPRPEDERDLSLIGVRMPMFRALAGGYLSAAHAMLTPAERAALPFSGKLITFETGVRFLTDFLLGDRYFKIQREGHNLDRCRSQFRLVESIEEHEEAMNEIVREWKPSA